MIDLDKLDERLSVIDNVFEYVNCGGCACVANFLAHRLRTVFPIMRITASGCYCDDPNIDKIRNVLGDNCSKYEWNINGFDFRHVWVEIYVDDEWWALDSTGVTPIDDMYDRWGTPAEGSFMLDEVKALADNPDWNDVFDRDQIPFLEMAVDTQLSDLIH